MTDLDPILEGNGFRLDPSDTRTIADGPTLYRVIATRDRVGGRLRQGITGSRLVDTLLAGTKGGWVASVKNLADDAWLDERSFITSPDVRVSGTAWLENSVASGSARISEWAHLKDSTVDSAHVSGFAAVESSRVRAGSKVDGDVFLRNSTVEEVSTVTDGVFVEDSLIQNECWIGDQSMVVKSTISTRSLVLGNARVHSSVVKDDTVVSGSSHLSDSTVAGKSKIMGNSLVHSSTVEGKSEVAGSAEIRGSYVSESLVVGSGKVSDGSVRECRVGQGAHVLKEHLEYVGLGG